MDATEAGTVLKTRYEERFQIPLAIALLALVAEMLHRRPETPRRWTMNSRSRSFLLAGVLTLLGGEAHRKTEKGNRLYLNGANEDALRSYTEAQLAAPEAPQLHYDIGNVLYRQEN